VHVHAEGAAAKGLEIPSQVHLGIFVPEQYAVTHSFAPPRLAKGYCNDEMEKAHAVQTSNFIPYSPSCPAVQ